MALKIKKTVYDSILSENIRTHKDFIKQIITWNDFRYYVWEQEMYDLCCLLNDKAIEWRIFKVKDYPFNWQEYKKGRMVRGHFHPNVLQHLELNDYKLIGYEIKYIDAVMKKKTSYCDIELRFEFGQTKAAKLYDYLCYVPYFIIGIDKNRYITIKRGRTFEKYFTKLKTNHKIYSSNFVMERLSKIPLPNWN